MGALRPVALLAVALAGAALVPLASARFINVGNGSSPDTTWTQFWDYKEWQAQNPLYEGDIVSECNCPLPWRPGASHHACSRNQN